MGSACSSETFAPSHVLMAMNLKDELIEGSLRIGVGKFTNEQEIEQAVDILTHKIAQVDNLL